MSDALSNPEAFARANTKADREYLDSLTPEKAARALERLLELGAEFPRRDPPLPTCWPAVLIGRDEDDVSDADRS